MSEQHKIRCFFRASFSCFALTSATFLWMPFATGATAGNRAGAVITGLIFWLSLISGGVLAGLAGRAYRSLDGPSAKTAEMQRRIGAVTFLSNTIAVVADVMLGLIVLFGIVTACTRLRETYVPYFLLFSGTAALSAHCFFNGRIYNTVLKPRGKGDK